MDGSVSLSQDQLESWGESIGREAELPLVLALRGELGAGKSTLARAVARGAGVVGTVPSPTFNLLLTYRGTRAAVQHLDLFRLGDPSEVWELGWEELGTGRRDLVLIEWPEKVEELLPADRWDIMLREEDDPTRRRIRIMAVGSPPPVPPPSPSHR